MVKQRSKRGKLRMLLKNITRMTKAIQANRKRQRKKNGYEGTNYNREDGFESIRRGKGKREGRRLGKGTIEVEVNNKITGKGMLCIMVATIIGECRAYGGPSYKLEWQVRQIEMAARI